MVMDARFRGRFRRGDGESEGRRERPGAPSEPAAPVGPFPADDEPNEAALSQLAPSAVAPVVVPRWVQAVVLPLALLGVWALARAAGPVLVILLAASTIALILNPIVRRLERGRLPRGLAIFFVYLTAFA